MAECAIYHAKAEKYLIKLKFKTYKTVARERFYSRKEITV